MKLKLLLFAVLFVSTTQATHLLGGEITWECLSNGKYRFTLTLYRDATGIPLTSVTENLSTNAGSSITCHLIFNQFLPSDCSVPSLKPPINGTVGVVEQFVYQSNPIKLTGSPPPTGWYFAWNSCCRPDYLDNLLNPDNQAFGIRAFMFPYTPLGGSQPLYADPCYNSSPQYVVKPNHQQCAAAPASYLGIVNDKENDSLLYELAEPKQTIPAMSYSNVIWQNGYSYLSPLPDTVQNSVNVPATMNPNTGEMTFTSFTIGAYQTCVKTSEFRDGQLISEIYRDIPIFIKSCSPTIVLPCSPAADSSTYSHVSFSWSNPQDSLIQIFASPTEELVIFERVQTALVGDSVLFTMNASDLDVLPNCDREEIRISAYGRHMSRDSLYSSTSDCIGGFPCATLQSLNLNGTFVDTISNSISFKWYVDTGFVVNNPVEFLFSIDNNTCPNITSKKVKVLVNLANAVGLDEQEKSFEYYPQPFNGVVTFEGLENGSALNVQILDVTGRILQEERAKVVEGKINIQTSHLKQGVYVFVLSWSDYSTAIKLIKHE